MPTNDTPYWHEHNPWKDRLVYVPAEELVECCAVIGNEVRNLNGEIFVATAESILKRWSLYGDKLDAYILPFTADSGGIRYGPEGDEYLSPSLDYLKLKSLLMKYQT